MKKQIENALNAITRKFGKMGYEKLEAVILNDLSVDTVGIGSVSRQFYQSIVGIVVVVKYALS